MFSHPPFSLLQKCDFAIVFPLCTLYTEYIDKYIHPRSLLLFPPQMTLATFLLGVPFPSFFVAHIKATPIMHM
jgi:hypothetical protein